MIIHTDGGMLRTNPGPAVWAFVVREQEGGEIIHVSSGHIDDANSTNNVAEYRALIQALIFAEFKLPRPHTVQIRSDSKLIVNQVNGVWSVKHESMLGLWAECVERIDALLLKGINVDLQHIHREENVEADAECNRLKEEISSAQVK